MEQWRSSCLEEPLFQKRTYSWGRCTTEFRSNALQNISCLELLRRPVTLILISCFQAERLFGLVCFNNVFKSDSILIFVHTGV